MPRTYYIGDMRGLSEICRGGRESRDAANIMWTDDLEVYTRPLIWNQKRRLPEYQRPRTRLSHHLGDRSKHKIQSYTRKIL